VRQYVPREFNGHLSLFLPNRSWLTSEFDPLRWKTVVRSCEQYCGPDRCNLEYMLRGEDTPLIAQFFKEARNNVLLDDHARQNCSSTSSPSTPSAAAIRSRG
jgi:hypothetical protein